MYFITTIIKSYNYNNNYYYLCNVKYNVFFLLLYLVFNSLHFSCYLYIMNYFNIIGK